MNTLEKLFRKKRKQVIGLMSGTSVDGIDAVLVAITGSGTRSNIRQRAFQTYPYPRGFKQFLLKNSDADTARLDEVTRLDMLVATFFADAAKRIARTAGLRMDDVDLIGSHGQTIHHLPQRQRLFGKSIRSTLQIGNPSALAKFTGVVTVGDFRVGDIAVGGSGAPLVPLFDYLMLRSRTMNRAVLNIGGIANITVLPRNCSIGDVVAFDTGPGNMIIDALTHRFINKPFDNGGMIASRGHIIPELLQWMIKHPYLRLKPPKSTGREAFGQVFVDEVLKRGRGMEPADLVATSAEFMALSIFQSYLRFIRRKTPLAELFVSGGGVHNAYVMEALRRYFTGISIRTTDELGISSDAKEALCFALFANEAVAGHAGNVPGATGARMQTILGVIALP
ncbi:MAG: anhydro-N-acetylmuramic acid kinase [Ignavibacteriae bacterium]|nr:anhydro-N-acetylmuramic acid kinase [Ignavibacteria bacterium]MBI3363275.1 anhydro-N-acetylmuramic acid kinase [Ignavibacteriota bacterium]